MTQHVFTREASPLKIGVLALQGAFAEHASMLATLGVKTREIRQLKDFTEDIQALVIPGGESTTIGKLLVELNLMEPITARIRQGMPVYGTCAGMILLCKNIENSDQPRIGLLDATVRRNAFGRQVESFEEPLVISGIPGEPYTGVFIRAPLISAISSDVEILAMVERNGGKYPVAIRQGNILATSFHPELTSDTRLHNYFIEMIKRV